MAKRANNPYQELLSFECEHASPFVKATATITCATNANMADTDYITINDGFQIVLYEYDKSADGVTAGRVAWDAGASTAADVAATLATAIAANQPGITVTDNLDGTLTLTSNWPGAAANKTVLEAVTHASFTVSGFTLGADPLSGHSTSFTKKLETAQRVTRVDKVEYINSTGLAAHADNYWEIRLLRGAALVVADKVFTAEADDEIMTSVAHGLLTGDGPFQVSNSGGGLPTGLSALTDYWIIKIDADDFYLATSLANALAGTNVSISTDGTGTQTLADTSETRRQTTMAQWSTDSDAQGALAAGKSVNPVLSATDANLVAAVGDVFSIALVKVASAANLPAGRLVVHARYVS